MEEQINLRSANNEPIPTRSYRTYPHSISLHEDMEPITCDIHEVNNLPADCIIPLGLLKDLKTQLLFRETGPDSMKFTALDKKSGQPTEFQAEVLTSNSSILTITRDTVIFPHHGEKIPLSTHGLDSRNLLLTQPLNPSLYLEETETKSKQQFQNHINAIIYNTSKDKIKSEMTF